MLYLKLYKSFPMSVNFQQIFYNFRKSLVETEASTEKSVSKV